jgi:hypothetical protein
MKIYYYWTIFESEIILIPPSLKISESNSNESYRNTDEVEMPVKNQLQGMLAVFEPLDRAQSKKNFEPSFVKIG